MRLSEISIRRPVFAWMLMVAIIVFGLISYDRLGISLLPDVDFPVVSVSFNLPGAAPEVMESQVLDPVEDAIMEMAGIRSVSSTAQQSSANISVELELGADIDVAVMEINNRIQEVQNLLPTNLFPAIIKKINPEDQPILWLALMANDPSVRPIDLMIYARNTLQNRFAVVPGVGNIVVGGYVDPALRVWLDPKKMNALDLSSDDILTAVSKEQVEWGGGHITNKQSEWNIRIKGESESPADFGNIHINMRVGQGPNFRSTLLSEVAQIEEGTADVRRICRINRRVGVGLGIIKQHGANAVEVADAIRAKLEEIAPTIPKQFKVEPRTDNTRSIRQSVRQLLFTLCLSALLTSLVCFLFLGSWTSAINVLMAIPTSVIGTFTAFYFFGFTLNTFTLLGLSLAIGILVDDAIMMLENIVRHQSLGESPKRAAINGANEISFAAIAATLAIVSIFLPVVFMKGIIGRYFFQYGITVTVAVLLSLLEALTLTPMRCSRYLRIVGATLEAGQPKEPPQLSSQRALGSSATPGAFYKLLPRAPALASMANRENRLPWNFGHFVDQAFKKSAATYAKILVILLNHRWLTLLCALIVFAASSFVGRGLPAEMMPAQDQSVFMLRFKLPVGTPLDITSEKMKVVEDYLLKLPEVEGLFSVVGGFGADAVNQGLAYTSLVDRNKRNLSQAEVINKVRGEIKNLVPEMETTAQDLSMRGFSASRGFPIEFVVQGPDWDKLTELSNKIMDQLKSSGAVVDVNTDVQSGMPEVKVTPNREKMAARGVQVKTVTNALNTLMGGYILNRQAQYPKDNHRYEIEVRMQPQGRTQIEDLQHVMVRNNRGNRIPLSELVDQEVKPSLLLISRLDRFRAITIYGSPAPGHAQREAMDLAEKIAKSNLPAGYNVKMTGSSKSFEESFQSLFFALALGIVVSYMVLASQFNSFLHPITILMALPFSFSGAFVALKLGHQSVNMYSLIGFILLMGIVKKNSIMMVDYTNRCRAEGLDVHSALLKACPVRLRPILMTSIATVAAALPEALSFGPGSEVMIPMAISIIGGVIASTTLTLFVVPCAYSLISRLERPMVTSV
jgi:HAE1 family hydrophobic/amphiphilic exporter-1